MEKLTRETFAFIMEKLVKNVYFERMLPSGRVERTPMNDSSDFGKFDIYINILKNEEIQKNYSGS
jgi:hypothetical protein